MPLTPVSSLLRTPLSGCSFQGYADIKTYFFKLSRGLAGQDGTEHAGVTAQPERELHVLYKYTYIGAGALSRARCPSPPAAAACGGSRVGGSRKQTHVGVAGGSSTSPQDLWLSLPAGMRLRPGRAAGDVLWGWMWRQGREGRCGRCSEPGLSPGLWWGTVGRPQE